MTPLHSQIKNLLLPLLLNATGEARAVAEPKPKRHPKEDEIKAAFKAHIGLFGSDEWFKSFYTILGLIVDQDLSWIDEKEEAGKPLTLFSCVVFLGSVYCVSHTIKRNAFSPKLAASTVPPDKFEIATDEQVEEWIDALTPSALKQILLQGEFAPALAALFQDEEGELVAETIDLADPKVGDKVIRGASWKWGSQDGGAGEEGTITRVYGSELPGWVLVKWRNGNAHEYRMGAEGAFDLDIISRPQLATP